MSKAEGLDFLTQDEITAITIAVARYQAGPDWEGPPPVPDLDHVAKVVHWAQCARLDSGIVDLVINGEMLIDYVPDQDDVVTVLLPD